MITLTHVYVVTGLFLACCALQTLSDRTHPRRFSSAAFWSLLAIAFLFGDLLPSEVMGVLVIALACIAGSGGVRPGSYPQVTAAARLARARALGHRLFVPVLLISLVTLFCSLGLKHVVIDGAPLLGAANTTVISLGIACVVAFGFALRLTREPVALAIQGGRQLLDAIGWAALLPLLLAMLGGIFAAAGVGELVAAVLTQVFPLDLPWVAVLAYAFGMALFTMIMGNAFAAFPVMSIGIALPVLVAQHGANPAPLAAIGMLAGYCGTLLTPMAANFNVVPAALLQMRDQNAVIRAQLMTALPLFACNVLLLLWLALP
jgi:uncharacterized membrane protein